jgi:hypothetical protein
MSSSGEDTAEYPLLYSSYKGDVTTVKELLRKYAPNGQGPHGSTCLHAAGVCRASPVHSSLEISPCAACTATLDRGLVHVLRCR